MFESKDWSTNSNEAVQISLRNPPSSKQPDAQFQPAFTYPIYGDEETIFGYRRLKIKLDFAADTLRPSLDISWREKFSPVGDTRADEVEDKLKEFLPTLSSEPATSDVPFTPPGELLHRYDIKGRSFGVWSAILTDPGAKQILRHMQILIPMFIEGGTLIELDDPEWTIERWRVFFLYAIDPDPSKPDTPTYSFAGYSTAYRLFFYDHMHPDYYKLSNLTLNPIETPLNLSDPKLPSTLPSRQRISQFLILPPFQSAGHGSHLYSTVLTYFLPQPTIREITVEDPNESFDDLRDINDLLRLRQPNQNPDPPDQPRFTDLKINTSTRLPPKSQPLPRASLLDMSLLSRLQTASKLCARQFLRLVEMQLLSRIPPRHRSTVRISRRDRCSDEMDRCYYFWRLVVKQRLYKHNKEVLSQMEVEERVEKLEETIVGVEREYERILGVVERRERRRVEEEDKATAMAGKADGEGSAVNGTPKRGAKRRIIDDDDDDDDDGDEHRDGGDRTNTTKRHPAENAPATDTQNVEPPSKKVRVDDPAP